MALVESFVRFARDVGATVCAEGIESLDELAVLADLDVEWGQGYVLARPEPPGPRSRRSRRRSAGWPSPTASDSLPDRAPARRRQRPAPGPRQRPARGRQHPARPRGRAGADRGRARLVEGLPLGLPRDEEVLETLVENGDRDRRDRLPDSTSTRSARPSLARPGARADARRRPRERPARGRRCCSASASAPAHGPGRQSRREHRDHRGLPARRARLDAGRGQPRPGDREPVRVRDPDALRTRRRARARRAPSRARASGGRGTRAGRDSGRPHICTTSARPSWTSRTISSPVDPLVVEHASVPVTVSAAAAWPKPLATLMRQCQSACE